MTEPTNLVSPEWAAERNFSVLSRDDLHTLVAGVIPHPNQTHALFVGRPGDGKASSIRRSAQMLQAGFLEIDLDAIRQGANPDGSLSIGGLAHVRAVMNEARAQGNTVVLAQLPENFPAGAARQIRETLQEEARQTSLEDRKVLVTLVANQDTVDTPAFAEFAKLVPETGPVVLADIDPSADIVEAHIARFNGFLLNKPTTPLSVALLDRMRILKMPEEPFSDELRARMEIRAINQEALEAFDDTLRSRVEAMDTPNPEPLSVALINRCQVLKVDQGLVDRLHERRTDTAQPEVDPKGPKGPAV